MPNIQRALSGLHVPPGADIPSDFDAFDVFAGYLMLDALVANRDRHDENWAVLRPVVGTDLPALAGSYDHAGSLGYNLTDAERERHLREGTLQRWVRKGTARAYLSDELFPLFQQRVMNPRSPDYERYIRSLSLPSDATPWEQLARSGGKRTGDTIQLFPAPIVRVDGSSRCCFLVHGVRHIEKNYNSSVQQRIQNLHKGDSLQLVPEPDNEVNPRALLTSTEGGDILGWVPDLLLDHMYTLRESGPVELRVEHTNGPNVPYHFRLIACAEGRVPAGYQPFAGPGWEFM